MTNYEEFEKDPAEEDVNPNPASVKFGACDSAEKAEWCLKKLLGLTDQLTGVQSHAKEEIERAKSWGEKESKKLIERMSWFQSQLKFYAINNLPPKAKSISLINGTLKFRQSGDKYDYEEEKVIEVLKKNPAYASLVKTEEHLAWGELKSYLNVEEGKVLLNELELPITVVPGELGFNIDLKSAKVAKDE